MASNAHIDRLGSVIDGQFEILDVIGSGGMGAVFLAEQTLMRRKVAIKIMHAAVDGDDLINVQRFYREARAIAKIDHPNVVKVHMCGQTKSGEPYIAMEYINGKTLIEELEEVGKLGLQRTCHIIGQLALALSEAHTHGIIHRDLKPENIILSQSHRGEDHVKVLDFGIVKLQQPSELEPNLTHTDVIFGTPRYMSPEQIRQEEIDGRSDIYSLGVIFYQLLTGEHPFQASNSMDYLVKHISEPAPIPTEKFPEFEIPIEIEQIVLRCLEKKPEQRFQTALELHDALNNVTGMIHAESSITTAPHVSTENDSSSEVVPSDISDEECIHRDSLVTLRTQTFWLTVALVISVTITGFVTVLVYFDGKSPLVSAQERINTVETIDTAVTAAPDTPHEKSLVHSLFEDLPLPSDIEISLATPDYLIGETPLSVDEVIEFYHAGLAEQCGRGFAIPNGFQYLVDCPLGFWSFHASETGTTLLLSRQPYSPSRTLIEPGEQALGIQLFPGARELVRTSELIVYNVSAPSHEVINFYSAIYVHSNKTTMHRSPSDDRLIVRSDNPEDAFRMFSVMGNVNAASRSATISIFAANR